MKKIVLFIGMSVSLLQAELKNTVVTAAPHVAFALPALASLRVWNNIEAVANKHFTLITHKTLVDFLQAECAKVTSKKIRFFVGDTKMLGMGTEEHLAAAIGRDIIVFHPQYHSFLEQLFAKTALTEQDQASLNILRFLIQHEAMHVHKQDSLSRVQAIIGVSIAKMVAFELIKNYCATKSAKWLTFFGVSLAGNLLFSAYVKSQERRADEAVHGETALQGGKMFFTNMLQFMKTNPKLYVKSEVLNISHPTVQSRLERIEKRIAAYQQQTARQGA